MAPIELPEVPAWYAEENLVPPPVPTNRNLRSFGSPDYDEAFWESEAPATELCAEIKALNREAVALFCGIVRDTADDKEELEMKEKTDAMEAKFAAAHAKLASLRVDQGRKNLLAHLENETLQRQRTAARMREATARARAEVAALLAAPDVPPFVDPRCTNEAVVARAMRGAEEFHAHEAAEHARLCLAGTPPPPEPPWRDGVQPPLDVGDLEALLAELPGFDGRTVNIASSAGERPPP